MRGKKGSSLPTPTLVCQHCGENYKPKQYSPSLIGKLKYCSRPCSLSAKHASAEVREKIRKAASGRVLDANTRAKMSESRTGEAIRLACNRPEYLQKIRGPGSPCWIPDREGVRLRRRIGYLIRTMLRRTLRATGQKKRGRTEAVLGYTTKELRRHLESKFRPGMSWKTYGRRGWHVDHVRPISDFPPGTPPAVINALPNLQPLWWWENASKGCSYAQPDES